MVIVCEAQTPNNFGNKGYLGFEHVTMVFPFCLTSHGRTDQPSRRSLWGETSSTCLSSPWRNARGWMRIIKRYGRNYPHLSRATQGPKRGCIASARHYNTEVGVRLYHTWPEWDSCLYLVSLLDLGSSVDTERCDSDGKMTASMVSRTVLMSDNEPLARM